MSEDFPRGLYRIIFEIEGKSRALSVHVDPEGNEKELKIVELNEFNQDQVWSFFVNNDGDGLIRSLLYPNMSLDQEHYGDEDSEAKIKKIGGNPYQTFRVSSGKIHCLLNDKVLMVSHEDHKKIIFTSSIQDSVDFRLDRVDEYNYDIAEPPYCVPFAIVFSKAAQEFAVTVDTTRTYYDRGHPLSAEPFVPGEKSTQYFYYIPNHNYAIYSAAQSNFALDTMLINPSQNNIYVYPHHGEKNQQWLFKNHSIEVQHNMKFLNYLESSELSFVEGLAGEVPGATMKFSFVPLWEKIPGLLEIPEVVNSSDNSDDPFADDFLGFGDGNDNEEEEEISNDDDNYDASDDDIDSITDSIRHLFF